MITGRHTGRKWDVFQHTYWGWFYTDGRGVIRGPFDTEEAAREALRAAHTDGAADQGGS